MKRTEELKSFPIHYKRGKNGRKRHLKGRSETAIITSGCSGSLFWHCIRTSIIKLLATKKLLAFSQSFESLI